MPALASAKYRKLVFLHYGTAHNDRILNLPQEADMKSLKVEVSILTSESRMTSLL